MYCTYHSAARVGEALRTLHLTADLLVCDEAHHCTGSSAKRDAQPLLDAFLPAARRLFLTATPRHATPFKDRREGRHTEAASPALTTVKLRRPACGRLACPHTTAPGVDVPGVAGSLGRDAAA